MSRLDEIFSGPWVQDAELAEKWLRARRRETRADIQALVKVFSPHWERTPNDQANEIRSSFDAALTPLQLADLAVATGYLDIEAVKGPAHEALDRLLWSEAARGFINSYDYLGVRYLAGRLGVDIGLRPVRPPTPILSPTLFAAFLAQFRDWYADDNLNVWLDFLDDYVEIDREAVRFERYLRSGRPPKDEEALERFEDLLVGLDAFLLNLDGIFAIIPRESRAMFGLLHSYWISAFFGYELDRGRYVHRYIDWAPAVRTSPLVTADGRSRWRAPLTTLRVLWRDIRALVEGTEAR